MVTRKGPALECELRRRIASGETFEVKGVRVDKAMLEEGLAKVEHQAKTSERWAPPKSSSARWTPGPPSAALLAAKALAECEHAEVFTKSVRVVSKTPVGLFAKPDVLSELTGEHVPPGPAEHEVVARFVSPKDGRVYVRMRQLVGWASTRSCELFSEQVLAPAEGDPPLEPSKFSEPLQSKALEILPVLDAAQLDSLEQPDHEGEEEEEQPEEQEEPEEEAEEAPESEDQAQADDEPTAKTGLQQKPRSFKVVVGRCPIISTPNASELFAGSTNELKHKKEFMADAALFVPSENRTYLRLTRGRGWVCEQSRGDLRRVGVVPTTRRKQPLSRKMARVIAFRGGDADGLTKLKREDLTKNRSGKIVSKRASEAAKKRANESIGKWTLAAKRAREELGLEGFVALKKGTPMYDKAMEYYKQKPQGATGSQSS